MVRVKVCGITNVEDASKVVYYGASAIGFIFHKKSPRYVSPSRARKIIESLPPFVTPVGVFVDLSEKAVRDICKFTRIRTAQFHGDESTVYCKRFSDMKVIKAFRVYDNFDFDQIKKFKVDAFLFDTFQDDVNGGTGKTFNWDQLKGIKFDRPIILSGGLSAENIHQALDAITPFAIDISSSLEKTPGIKNPRLVREFFDVLSFKAEKK